MSSPQFPKVTLVVMPRSDKDFGARDAVTVLTHSGVEHIEQVNGRTIVLMDPDYVDKVHLPPPSFVIDHRDAPPPPWKK